MFASLPSSQPVSGEFLALAPESIRQWAQTPERSDWQRKVCAAASGTEQEEGGVLARSFVTVALVEELEGPFLEVQLPCPETKGWGKGLRDDFLRQQALVRCVRRLQGAAEGLLDAARRVQGTVAVDFVFNGDWDESLEPLRKQMVKELLCRHYGPAHA